MTTVEQHSKFRLTIPTGTDAPLVVPMHAGDVLFILGANGTGKSSLIHHLYRTHSSSAIRISAHRQTWLESSIVAMTARQKQQQESNMRQGDTQMESRWRDNYHSLRPNMAIFNLVDAENSMAREIADAVRVRDYDRAQALAEQRFSSKTHQFPVPRFQSPRVHVDREGRRD